MNALPASSAWSLLTARTNLNDARIVADATPAAESLAPNEALLRLEKFAFTASNITYAALGEQLYWKFFPAPDGYGRVPVWGFARVEYSNVSDLAVGTRLRGYFPLASHLRIQPQIAGPDVMDTAVHRAQLPAFYNRYPLVNPTPVDGEDREVALLFGTAFLLDDFVVESSVLGAQAVVILSASSKTALATAFLLRQRGIRVIGVTSARHLEFVTSLGYYDSAMRYEDIANAVLEEPVFVIDFAGNADVLRALYQRCGQRIVHAATVGRTHWQASTDLSALPGPEPKLFFAPERVTKRMTEWGPATFGAKHSRAWSEFSADADRWLKIQYENGPEGALKTYRETLAGDVSPASVRMVRLT